MVNSTVIEVMVPWFQKNLKFLKFIQHWTWRKSFILTLLTWFDLLNLWKLECETKKSKMWVWTVKKLRITSCQKFNFNVTFESFDFGIKKTSVFDYSLNVQHYVFFGFWTTKYWKILPRQLKYDLNTMFDSKFAQPAPFWTM